MEQSSFKPIRSHRLYRQIVDQIRDLVTRGQLRPGQQLPSEKQLMERFGVGRSTIREAFAVLETLGIIELAQGKGAFVRVESIETLQLKLDSAVTPDWLTEAWDLFTALAAYGLRLAFHRDPARWQDPAAFENKLRAEGRLQAENPSRSWTVDNELTYLLALMEASGNRLILHVAEQAAQRIRAASAKKVLPSTSMETHRQILQHLREEDVPRATTELIAHLRRLAPVVTGT